MASIILHLANAANTRLLLKHLEQYHQVQDRSGRSLPSDDFDLAVVDGQHLIQFQTQIQARKKRESPLILPFLFLAECGENEMTNWALGSLVEDTLIFPVNIQALDARISNLLKLRLMSQEQQRYSRNIEEAHQRAERSLKMIQETNRVAIKAENEQELLDNFCSIVCRYGGYAAVCIHYMRKEQEEENTLRCVASSGSQDISELESRIFQGNRNTACPIYLAIDTNTHQIVRQGADNPKFQPFLDHLRKAGLQTALCVPLGFGQRIYGETEFYSSSTNRFFRYRPCVWIRSFNQMAAEGRKIGFTCGILAGCP